MQAVEVEVAAEAAAKMVELDMVAGPALAPVPVNIVKDLHILMVVAMVDILALVVPVVAVVEGKLVAIKDLVDMGLVVALVLAQLQLLTIGIDKVVQMQMLVETVVAMAEEEMVGVVQAKVLDLGMAMPTPSPLHVRNLKKWSPTYCTVSN
ncbi:hypothetical protein VPH35_055525 [Triticum aestivum]